MEHKTNVTGTPAQASQTRGPACDTGFSSADKGRMETKATGKPAAEEMKHETQQVKGEMQHKAEMTKEQVKQRAQETSQQIKESAYSAAEQAKQQANAAMMRLKEQGSTMLEQQKDRAVEEIHHFTSAMHEAADRLHREHDDNIASYIEAAAGQLEGMADYLRNRKPGHLLSDLQGLARRQPEMFAGGMFIAGLALARFLKASSPGPRQRGHRMESGGNGHGLHTTPYVPPYAATSNQTSSGLTSSTTPDITGGKQTATPSSGLASSPAAERPLSAPAPVPSACDNPGPKNEPKPTL